MKTISKSLFYNLGWKLVSLMLAVVLWFICMNVDNPVASQPFDLTLHLDNKERIEENRYVLLNEAELLNRKITVRIRTSSRNLTELRRRNLRAYIDLSPIDILSQKLGEPQPLTVALEIPLAADDYEITYQSPTKVNVTVDKYMSEIKSIEVDKLGEAMEDYISSKAELTPSMLTISGAQTVLSQVGAVRVKVDLSGATQDVETTAAPVVYDKMGNDITDQVKLDQTEIHIKVPVAKYAVIPIQVPRITGSTAEGYAVTNVDWYPREVEIVGDSERIGELNSIELPALNISGETETVKRTFDLRDFLISPDLAVRNGTPQEALVTVVIEKEALRELEISVEKLRIVGMTSVVDLITKNCVLTVKGVERIVTEMDPEILYGTLDLTGLPEGTHEIAVSFELPPAIVQVGEATVMVSIAAGLSPEQDEAADLEEEIEEQDEENPGDS